jgi:7-keto-8-aminopelargonate synthetase-like enzyme
VGLVKSEKALRRRLEQNIDCVKNGLRRGGVSVADTPSPIISITPRQARDAERLRKQLLASRIYPSFIRYPGGAAAGYFRFAISSEHSDEQLQDLVRTLAADGAPGKARKC